MIMDEGTLLSISNLKVKIDKHVIINGISFEVKKDDVLAVVGPNGAGKTVLFRTLLGFIPFEGEITWQDNLKIGYVPQKLSIAKDLPLTTQEFLSLKEKNKKNIIQILEDVGFEENKPHERHLSGHILKRRLGVLSGGELQRVLIAFALLGHPNVLLFDEPTAGVDLSGEETIYSLLHKLQAKQDLTILLISHEPEIVHDYADKILDLGKQKHHEYE